MTSTHARTGIAEFVALMATLTALVALSIDMVLPALPAIGESLGVRSEVDPSGICELSRLVEARSGIAVPPNKPVVGRNAFRHASGIHQDGVIKCRETYEVLDPASIGHPTGTQIVLGKLSGRAGFAARVRALHHLLVAHIGEGDPLLGQDRRRRPLELLAHDHSAAATREAWNDGMTSRANSSRLAQMSAWGVRPAWASRIT